mgnify:CR=1 FL=1
MKKNRKENSMGAALDASNQLSRFIPEIKKMVANGNTTIIIFVSIAILLSAITIIRQQKILRKLDELTKKTEEPSTEDKP